MPSHSIFVSTVPFGERDHRATEILDRLKVPYAVNPLGRRLTDVELAEMIGEATILIAGTEPINQKVLTAARRLKLIARVGVGLDSVDLPAAREKGIEVSYTPDAPAPAVAELTLGLMLNSLRGVSCADRSVRQGSWRRVFGRRLGDCTIGIIGVGRIGSLLLKQLLGGFPGVRILANDLKPNPAFANEPAVNWVDKKEIFQTCDLVSLHVPLTRLTRNLVCRETLELMKPEAYLINTSRGQVVLESDLAEALAAKKIAGAALDVFEHEPYEGPLLKSDRCLFTCHMGSMTQDCRSRMELEAVEDAARFIRGEPLRQPVPENEYQAQLHHG